VSDKQAECDMNFLSYVREEVADGARDKFFTVDFVADIMAAVDRVIAERNEMQRELRKAETECSMLRVECGVLEKNAETTYENHKRIVAELTAERDEARRDVCHMMHWTGFLAGDYARSRGWDCFKDDKHEVSAEILNFRDIWSAYAHRHRDERDEARREICVMLEDATNDHRENHAKRWGWDCFKEDGK
jgi:hypothetical protein